MILLLELSSSCFTLPGLKLNAYLNRLRYRGGAEADFPSQESQDSPRYSTTAILCHLLPLHDATRAGTGSLVTTVKRNSLQLPTWEITQPCTQFKSPCPSHTPVKPSLDIGTHRGRKGRGRIKLSG